MITPETLTKALREIEKGYAQYQYFFDTRRTPAWLDPLRDAGFFRNPPASVRDGQYISFPPWPESHYLVRMAGIPEAQETVLRIALQIPGTDNNRVHADLVEIALTLPAALSAQLVPRICEAIPNSVGLLLAEKVGKLIVHLAAGGEGQAALQLANEALALSPDPRFEEGGPDEFVLGPDPRAHYHDWYYNRIIDSAIPVLVESSGLDAVRLFCSLLEQAIRFSMRPGEQGDEDYLYVWHPAVEDSKNPDYIPSALLCALRDVAEKLVEADPAQFEAVIDLLGQYRWVSFRRLQLHLARRFLDQGQRLAESILRDPSVIGHGSLAHEAILLLKAAFPQLTAGTQDQILNWIDAGPSEESMREWLEFVGAPVTGEKVRELIDRKRLEHFFILEGYLPERYQRTYEELKDRLGPPVPPERVHRAEFGIISAKSPRSAAELAAMTVEDVFDFLKTWEPGHDIFGPTADGLGSALSQAVSQRPADLAAVADRMQGLDPTYIRCVFSGLKGALKSGVAWEWEPVLKLAKWVVDQGRAIPGRAGGLGDSDPDWGWTRNAIIELLSEGFDRPTILPEEYRGLVWDVLRPLTDDPNPGLDDEGREHFDPSSLSINSTRGRAFDAVLGYARWLRRLTDPIQKAAGKLPITFEAMPVVREVLDAHLDVSVEPTLTIRSVYGRHLTLLAALDWNWLRANLLRIFPEGEQDRPMFTAAWESFVCFNRPNPALLPELLPAYRRAVAQIGQPGAMMRHPALPDERLAQHVMVYYWLGILEFGSADGLLDAFYANSPDKLRGHAMWFVGTSVSDWDDGVPPEVYERLRVLIERRIEAAKLNPADFADELASFGWWFASGKFNEDWSIKTLLTVLQLTGKAESEMDVVKLLATRCAKDPMECLTCLRLMIEGDRDGWLILGVENDAMELLRQAIRSDHPDAAPGARRLAEVLIARGHFGFRSLLAG